MPSISVTRGRAGLGGIEQRLLEKKVQSFRNDWGNIDAVFPTITRPPTLRAESPPKAD